MMLNAQQLYFLLLFVIATVVMHGFAARQPAILNLAAREQGCLVIFGIRPYGFLPKILNELLCYYNYGFSQLPLKSESLVLADSFARFGLSTIVLLQLEAGKATSRLARSVNAYLFAAQILTGACSLPLYLAALSGTSTRRHARLKPEAVYIALVSAVLGYGLPTYNIYAQDWSYGALSLWQIYPVFVMALQAALPRILAPVFRDTRTGLVAFLILFAGSVTSISSHFSVVNSGISLSKVYFPFLEQPNNIQDEIHVFFSLDYLFCIAAVASYLILRAGRARPAR